MTIDKDDLLNSILDSLGRIQHIDPEDIPNIDLYMDQVTTFMEKRLKNTTRNPEDKILTKTMINNYAKNNLLPPPVRKKYSKEHILLLIFIYYYKGILSISDIQTLLTPLSDKYFQPGGKINLEDIYKEVFSLEKPEVEYLKEDIIKKFTISQETFKNVPKEDQEILQLFSFISILSYDTYVKKLLIEKMIDSFREATAKDNSSKHSEGKERADKSSRK